MACVISVQVIGLNKLHVSVYSIFNTGILPSMLF